MDDVEGLPGIPAAYMPSDFVRRAEEEMPMISRLTKSPARLNQEAET